MIPPGHPPPVSSVPHTTRYTPRKADSGQVAVLLGILEDYYRTNYLPTLASPGRFSHLVRDQGSRKRPSSTTYKQINDHFLREFGSPSASPSRRPPPLHMVGVSRQQLQQLACPYAAPSMMIPCRRAPVRISSFDAAVLQLVKKGLLKKWKHGRSFEAVLPCAGGRSESEQRTVSVCGVGTRERVFLTEPVIAAKIVSDKILLLHSSRTLKKRLSRREIRFGQYWEEFDSPTQFCDAFLDSGDGGGGGSTLTGEKRSRPRRRPRPHSPGKKVSVIGLIDDCSPPPLKRRRRTRTLGVSVPALPNLLPLAVTALMRVESRSEIQLQQKLLLRTGVVRLQTEPETHRCEVTRLPQIRAALNVFENDTKSEKFRKCLGLYESELEREKKHLHSMVNRDPTLGILEFLVRQRAGSIPRMVSRLTVVDKIWSENPLLSGPLIDRTLTVMRRQGLLVEKESSWCISHLGEDVLRRRRLAPVRPDEALGSFRTNDRGHDGVYVWLVDCREWDLDKFATRENVFRDHILDSLERRGVLYQTRRLPLGDYFPFIRRAGIEHAVPLFVERKSVIDLIESFLSGRLQKQMRKLDRLRTHLPKAHVFLLVEGDFAEYESDLVAKTKLRPDQLKQMYSEILQEHESSIFHRVVRVQNENSLATLLYQWREEIKNRSDDFSVPMAELMEIMRRIEEEERSGLLVEELRSSQSQRSVVEESQPHSQPPSPPSHRRELSPDLVSGSRIRAKKKKKKKRKVKVSRKGKKRVLSRRRQPKRIRRKLPTLDQYLRKKESDSDSLDDSILHEDLLAGPGPKMLPSAPPRPPPAPRRRRKSSLDDVSLMRYSSSPLSSSSDVESLGRSSGSSQYEVTEEEVIVIDD